MAHPLVCCAKVVIQHLFDRTNRLALIVWPQRGIKLLVFEEIRGESYGNCFLVRACLPLPTAVLSAGFELINLFARF